ncbi:MAG: aryl-sulfate sulfotransferase [Candidatus Odinarchaeota archaeon]
MQKSLKIFLIAVILTIIVSTSIVGLFLFNMVSTRNVKPFNLDNAPAHIIEIKTELKGKLENNTFSQDDMTKFITFAQYVADNSPVVLDLAKNWEQVVFFAIDNSSSDMWWFIGDGALIVEFGTNPPQNYGILIELSFETVIDILRGDETPLSAFQKGDLEFKGPFNEVLEVAQIAEIASATIMDSYIPPGMEFSAFKITTDRSSLYTGSSFTIFPLFEIHLNPDHIGEHHMSSLASTSAVIVDQYGKIVARRENSAHTVYEFLNSTTIIMGGQEGYMELWNYKDDIVKTLAVPGGHHDFDYNPATNTFMMLEYAFSNETWDGQNVIYDLISEYNYAGELVWQWDPRIYFPFNATRHTSLGLNETFRGGADWMHSNSFSWDKNENTVYLLLRSLDAVLKINYTSKEIIWDAGRDGDFTLFNKAGEEVDTLFCHAHGMERIAPNRFIIFDNDLYNQSNPDTMALDTSFGDSRYLEFEIDEESRIMREVWSWIPPNQSYYFPESGGDVDRLPDGNTLGIFGNKGMILNMQDPALLTEVTRDGQVAWELQIPGANNTYYWIQNLQRFYEKPLIAIHNQSIDLDKGMLWLNYSVWNSFKQEASSSGTARIIVDGEEIYEETFEFLPQWQPKTLEITLNNLPAAKNIVIIIENSDGMKKSVIIYQESSDLFSFLIKTAPVIIIVGLGSSVIAIPAVILVRRTIKKRRYSEEIQE